MLNAQRIIHRCLPPRRRRPARRLPSQG
jgi:hypothetical protein